MLIVYLCNQLGNQMFQYALYRKLLYLGKDVKLDVRHFRKYLEHYRLDNIFDLNLSIATTKEIKYIQGYIARLKRKIFGECSPIFNEVNTDTMIFKKEVFQYENMYLYGFWQSEKYFSDIRNILLSEFNFPEINDDKNMDILKKIQQHISVSIHVRRGDYVTSIFPTMTKDYYQRAMDYFFKKYSNVFFVVFSDDISWAKKYISFKNGIFVNWNNGKESYKDMQLMSLCNHNIIANSSFSWWGAWLNRNEDKEIIAPSKWFYHRKTPDIYCPGWIIIDI